MGNDSIPQKDIFEIARRVQHEGVDPDAFQTMLQHNADESRRKADAAIDEWQADRAAREQQPKPWNVRGQRVDPTPERPYTAARFGPAAQPATPAPTNTKGVKGELVEPTPDRPYASARFGRPATAGLPPVDATPHAPTLVKLGYGGKPDTVTPLADLPPVDTTGRPPVHVKIGRGGEPDVVTPVGLPPLFVAGRPGGGGDLPAGSSGAGAGHSGRGSAPTDAGSSSGLDIDALQDLDAQRHADVHADVDAHAHDDGDAQQHAHADLDTDRDRDGEPTGDAGGGTGSGTGSADRAGV